MAKLIANRYANALFEIALELNQLDLFNENAKLVFDTLNNEKQFLKMLNHPQITSTEKINMLEKIFKNKISDSFFGLFSIVFNKNREKELIEIMGTFIEKVEKYKGIVKAVISSAVPLSDEQIKNIKQKLSQNINKQVVIQTEINPDLIGGVRINVDGHIIDGSIKKQLDDLKKKLLNVQLA